MPYVCPEVPRSPGGLRVTDKTSTSVTVDWERVAGAVTYVIEWTREESPWGPGASHNEVDPINTKETIHNLKPNTKYKIKVFAESEAGRSEPSKQLLVKTSSVPGQLF